MTQPASPPARALGLADLAGCLLLLAWLVRSWWFTGDDPDLFWHLKYGQMFLAARGLDVADDFGWTVPNAPWLDHEWGAEVLFATLYAAGGLGALQAFRWALFAGTLALAVRIFMRGGLPFGPAAFGAVALHVLLHGQEYVRVQNLTVALMLVTAAALQGWWLDRRLGWLGRAYPLIVMAWANLHGGGALAGVGSCWIALAAEAAWCLRTGRWAELRPLAYLAVGGSLAILVNPAGWHVPALSLSMLLDPAAKAVNAGVTEWHPPDLGRPETWASLGGAGAIAVAALVARRPPPPGLAAVVAAWVVMACLSRRNVALATMASAPLAAYWLGAARAELAGRSLPVRRAGAALLVACGAAAIAPAPNLRQTEFRLVFPYPSADALQATVALAGGRRMLNLYEWGGLLLYVGYPRLKVFVDGRGYPYGPGLMRDHATLFDLHPGWATLLAWHRIDMVVAPPAARLVGALRASPAWRVAYEDATAVVLTKVR